MSIIKIQKLTFAYDNSYDNIFENISLSLDTNWKLGLTGRNGCGKTTLLKLLAGKYTYHGTISSTANFEYFPFQVKDTKQFAIDIIKEKSHIEDYDYWKIQKELSCLNVDENILYQPFQSLSGGEQIKVLIVSLFLKDNSFLLIDEPTNHLDMTSRCVVSDYLKLKKGFILVSHDRNFLDNCIDHIMAINKTNIEVQKGNFSSWYQNKQNKDNFEITQNEKLKKEIAQLEKSAKQSALWSNKAEKSKKGTRNSGLRPDRGYVGHKAAKIMKRSKNAELKKQAAVETKTKLLKDIETVCDLKLNPLTYDSTRLINSNKLSLFRDQKCICKNIYLEVNQGDRIAICGRNGCGKTTILKFVKGDEKIIPQGNYKKSPNLKISYISQNTSQLSGNLCDFAKYEQLNESLFKTILSKLNIPRTQFERDISKFSEGQKKKVLIAKSLCTPAHIYLWDEPLNFIDILSRMQIENLILKFKPTLIFVEHDETFVKNIATKLINLT